MRVGFFLLFFLFGNEIFGNVIFGYGLRDRTTSYPPEYDIEHAGLVSKAALAAICRYPDQTSFKKLYGHMQLVKREITSANAIYNQLDIHDQIQLKKVLDLLNQINDRYHVIVQCLSDILEDRRRAALAAKAQPQLESLCGLK
eukprot:Platyproteum_vivax@DN545_c0_g1_i1.p1